MSDYRITVTVRNGRLWRAIQGGGFKTLIAFVRRHNLRYQSTSNYLSLRLAPFDKNGHIRQSASDLCDALGMHVTDVFPPSFLERCLARNSIEMDMTQGQLERMLLPPADPERVMIQSEAGEHVRALLNGLPPRDRLVIERRFGLSGDNPETLEEIAKRLGNGKENVRVIENRALRLLRAHERNPLRPESTKVRGIQLGEDLPE